MREIEELRKAVTEEEIDETQEALRGQRVPRVSKVWRLKEPTPATLQCYRCGNQWQVTFDLDADEERMCPACRSNSIRVVLT
jgi:DNA-directed RNA polymerase subunit RPC12/RpoP